MIDFRLSKDELNQMKTHYTPDDLATMRKIELRALLWDEDNYQNGNNGNSQIIISSLWDFAKEYYSLNNSYDALRAIVINTIDLRKRPFSIGILYDKYQRILRKNDYAKHIDFYTSLKETIFNDFLNLWDNKDGILKELSYFPNVPTIVTDTIIKFAIDSSEFYEQVMEFCTQNNFKDEMLITGKVNSGVCLNYDRLNQNQKKLLSNFKNLNAPDFVLNKELNIEKSTNLSNKLDILFQLYLLGNRNTEPQFYSWIFNDFDPGTKWDEFIIWFWNWAQDQKKNYYEGVGKISTKPIPKSLANFCRIINRSVADNNSWRKRGGDHYKGSPKDAWAQFKSDAGDARGRRNSDKK